MAGRLLLALLIVGIVGCGSGESGVLKLRVVDATGAPLAGAEVLYLAELREEPYGGIAIPPLANARALASARVLTIADGTVRMVTSGGGGLVVLAENCLPGGFLLSDELVNADGIVQLALRSGNTADARAQGPAEIGGEVVPIAGLMLSTWLHNKATTAYGHDLLIHAEEREPGVYEFPGLAAVPTPWTDGELRDIATIQVPGYSATGAVRAANGEFLVELGLAPRPLRLRYSGGEGLPASLLVEVHAVALAAEEAVPQPGPEDTPVWCAFGTPLKAGGTVTRAVAAWESAASAVFLLHLGEHGSRMFALPITELEFGVDAEPFDLTPRVRALLAAGA